MIIFLTDTMQHTVVRFIYLFYLIAFIALVGCNNNNKPVVQIAVSPASKTPALAEPFKYHKMLEVSPGNYYDVFSWGRGTKDGGQYMILRSDSPDHQYNAVNGDLEGPIQDVLNTDMDTDGNPEIIIYAKSIDTNRHINVFVYEYLNDNAHKIDFPRLTESQRKGYRGGDSFYLKDGKLMREFPVYNGKGKEATLSGQKRLIQYTLNSNTLYTKQISKDSTSTTAVKQPEEKPAKKVVEKKATNKHKAASKKKKRHTAVAKKHHRHRR